MLQRALVVLANAIFKDEQPYSSLTPDETELVREFKNANGFPVGVNPERNYFRFGVMKSLEAKGVIIPYETLNKWEYFLLVSPNAKNR